MKKSFWFVGTMALIASCSMATAADITGKVTLKGTPPPEKDIALDMSCAKLQPGKKPTTRFYVVSPDGGLADTVIYLKDGVTGKTTAVPSEAALINQVGCEYTPQIIAIQTGQKLLVRNSDPVFHNVHPTPAANKESNKSQAPGAKDLEFVFDKPEPFLKFKCDVHGWMLAWVFVSDHPYYSLSAKDGTYTIKNVPAGKYTVVAHHRKAGVSKPVEVTVANDPVKADFTLEVPAQ